MNRRIVLGVSADVSLVLMDGLPAFLAGKGFEVHVVSSPGERSDRLRNEASEVHVHAIPMPRRPAPGRDLVSLVAWIRLLRSVQPDTVMVGTPKAALLGIVAAWMTRVPDRIYLLRGLRLETTRGAQRAILTALERLVFTLSTRSLAVSASLAAEALRLHLVEKDHIGVLGRGSSNGVDLSRFETQVNADERARLRAALGLADVPTIGFVGRLTRDKGLSALAVAQAELDADGLAHQVLVVGPVDDLRTAQDDVVSAIYTGSVADTSLYYHLMDVLCLPTMREGFPNVVLEAAASGIPTVTTTATGAIDSVVDGETGLIVQSGDSSALAGALRRILSDDELRTRLGRQARAWVESDFDRHDVWALIEDYLARGSNVDRSAAMNEGGIE